MSTAEYSIQFSVLEQPPLSIWFYKTAGLIWISLNLGLILNTEGVLRVQMGDPSWGLLQPVPAVTSSLTQQLCGAGLLHH